MGNLFKTHSQSFGIVALVAITISTFIVFLAAKEQKDIRGRAAQITTTEKPAPQKISRAKTSAVLADTTGPNLVTNGDFSQGETDWTFYNPDSHNADNGFLQISNNQAKHIINNLSPNTTYQFSATVNPTNCAQITIFSSSEIASLVFLEFLDKGIVSTKEATFTTPNPLGTITISLYNFGNCMASTTYDNIGIYEVAPTLTPTPTDIPTPTPIPNHVRNGNFLNDREWGFENGSSHTINNGALEISSTLNGSSVLVARQDLNREEQPLSPNTVYKIIADVKGANGTNICVGRAGSALTPSDLYRCLDFHDDTKMVNKMTYFKTLSDNITYTVALFKGNSQTATFDNIGIFDAPGISLSPTNTVTPRLAADVDGNGCISITDFSEWVYAFKNSTLTNPNNPNSKPDVNGDGQVSILDFNDWLRVFKSGANACN